MLDRCVRCFTDRPADHELPGAFPGRTRCDVRLLVMTATSLLLVTGCADAPDAAVEAAAATFAGAVRSGDAQQACLLLAPLTREELESSQGQSCPEALAQQELIMPSDVAGLERFGRQATVVVQSTHGERDTWYFSRFDSRWLVVAAGCTPRGEQLPYDCDIEGP